MLIVSLFSVVLLALASGSVDNSLCFSVAVALDQSGEQVPGHCSHWDERSQQSLPLRLHHRAHTDLSRPSRSLSSISLSFFFLPLSHFSPSHHFPTFSLPQSSLSLPLPPPPSPPSPLPLFIPSPHLPPRCWREKNTARSVGSTS